MLLLPCEKWRWRLKQLEKALSMLIMITRFHIMQVEAIPRQFCGNFVKFKRFDQGGISEIFDFIEIN